MSAKKSKAERRAQPASEPSAPRAPDRALTEIEALLALAAPVAPAPSPRVKEALLERVRAQRAAAATAGWTFASMHEAAGWVATRLPGVRLKEVSLDPSRDLAMLFIEMAPGSAFPDHEHLGREQGLVLSGDIRSGGRLLHAGDFYTAEPGTAHADIVSPSGCTGLLCASLAAWTQWRSKLALT